MHARALFYPIRRRRRRLRKQYMSTRCRLTSANGAMVRPSRERSAGIGVICTHRRRDPDYLLVKQQAAVAVAEAVALY